MGVTWAPRLRGGAAGAEIEGDRCIIHIQRRQLEFDEQCEHESDRQSRAVTLTQSLFLSPVQYTGGRKCWFYINLSFFQSYFLLHEKNILFDENRFFKLNQKLCPTIFSIVFT